MEKRHGIDDLLGHADWLPALAARLVGDSDADDLAQETWMAALSSRAPGEEKRGRGWLTAVARNLSRKRWRGATARRRREQAVVAEAGETADTSSPEDLLLKAQLQRTLADLVVALEEPYRGTVVLRYFEGKSAAEIARALGLPAGTVRWRLKEAIDRLRVQLDARYDGDRRRWKAILTAALPATIGGEAVMVAMATTVATKKVLGGLAALLLLLATVGGLLHFGRGGGGLDHREGWREGALARRASMPLGARVQLPEEGNATGGIAGVVRRPDGAPVNGALVALSRVRLPDDLRPPGTRATALTDRAGRFAFEEARAGTYQVTATAHGLRASLSPVIALGAGERQQLDLTLGEGGATVSGQVLDEGGGPIPGAVVTASLGYPWWIMSTSAASERRFVAVADGDGRYQLTLEPREYMLSTEAAGYVPAEVNVAVTRDLVRDLELGPAALVSGRVVEKGSGSAVADAEVLLHGDVQRWAKRAVVTDVQGRFVIDDAPGGVWQLQARHRGRQLFAPARRVTSVATQAQEGVLIELEAGIPLSGRLSDQSGGGIPGVAIVVVSSETGAQDRARTISEAGGRFSTTVVGPGRYRVAVEGAGDGEAGTVVEAAVGPLGAEDIALVLERPPGQIRGRVVDAASRPVGGVLVQAANGASGPRENGFTETGPDGAFTVGALPESPVRLLAWHPTLGVAEVSLGAPVVGEDIELRLAAGGTIGGRVAYEDGGVAAGVSVSVTRMESEIIYESDTTGADGRFALKSLASGRYTVKATRKAGPHNMWGSSDEPGMKIVELAPGQQHMGVTLVLARGGGVLAGRVTFADGSPAVGARVAAAPEEEGRFWKGGAFLEHRSTVDADGRFRVNDVENATFGIWASFPGLPDAEVGGVRTGRGDIALVFPAPARVSGVVVDAGGRPVSAFHLGAVPVEVQGASARERHRQSEAANEPAAKIQEASGAFSLEGLQAGAYDLKVTAADGRGGGRHRVDLAAGENRTGLRLVVSSGVRATGIVVALESGLPLPGLTIWRLMSGRRVEVKTGEDGGFVLEGLVPGEEAMIQVENSQLSNRIPEYLELVVPAGTPTWDLGTFKLIKGDWRAAERTGTTVGLRLLRKEGRPTVADAPAGYPAAAAGIKPGDVVLAVDGQDVAGLGGGAIRHLMRRPVGGKVSLDMLSAEGRRSTVVLTTVKR